MPGRDEILGPACLIVSGTVRLLVLGGTSFVGRAIVDDALRCDAEVTLFGRGRTGADLFPGVPRRIGDRDTGDYAALRDGRWDAYGPLKAACEDDVLARYGQRATIVRPGKVAGPHDTQDTFTYWVRRAARGGRVALPRPPEQPVPVIDSRDP